MGSSSKTITDYNVVPLMKGDGTLYKSMMLDAYKKIPIGMRMVMAECGQGIVKLSSLYNSGFLNAMGYNPNELIQYNTLDENKLLQWVRDNLDADATGLTSYRLGSVTMEDMAIKHLQDTYAGFYVNNRVFTDTDGKMYVYLDTVGNGNMVDIVTYLNAGDTIDDYVATIEEGWTVVSYPINPTELNEQLYWVVTLTRTYSTTPEPPEEPVEVTETQVVNVPLVYNYKQTNDVNYAAAMEIVNKYNGYTVNEQYERITEGTDDTYSYYVQGICVATVTYMGNTLFNVSYVSSGPADYEAMVDCRNYVDVGIVKDTIALVEQIILTWANNGMRKTHFGSKASFGSVYTTKNAEAYPIIPLKLNGSIVNSNDKQYVTLGKIGLTGDDFRSSLRDKDINSAFLVFGMPITDMSSVGVKFMFESLSALIGGGTTNKFNATKEVLRVSFSSLSMQTALDVETKIIVGSIGEVGVYTGQVFTTTTIHIDSEDGSTTTVNYHRRYRKQVDPLFYYEVTVWDAYTAYTVAGYGFRASITEDKCIIPVSRDVLFKIDYKTTAYILEKSLRLMIFVKKTVKVKWYQSGIFQFVMFIVAVALTFTPIGGASASFFAGLSTIGQVIVLASFAVGLASIMGINTGILGQVIGVLSIIYGGMAGLTKGGWQGGLMTANSLVQAVSMANSIMIQRDIKALVAESEKATANNQQAQDNLKEQIEQLQNPLLIPYQDRLAEIDAYYEVASGNLQYNYDILYNYDMVYSKNMI